MERREAQERTSRALAQASTPYEQSGTRVDILALDRAGRLVKWTEDRPDNT